MELLVEILLAKRVSVGCEVGHHNRHVRRLPPPVTVVLAWDTIPLATNCVFYSTNLITWQVLTNFVSQIPYPSPAANVTVFDTITNGSSSRFYRVMVTPWLTYPF